jgi:hypothetical protein
MSQADRRASTRFVILETKIEFGLRSNEIAVFKQKIRLLHLNPSHLDWVFL